MKDYYSVAKETWKSLQDDVKCWVENQNDFGSAIIKQTTCDEDEIIRFLTQPTSIKLEIECD